MQVQLSPPAPRALHHQEFREPTPPAATSRDHEPCGSSLSLQSDQATNQTNESSPSMSMQTQLTTYLFKSKCNFAFENAKKNKQKVYPMVDLV
jgi:hypothetical protein